MRASVARRFGEAGAYVASRMTVVATAQAGAGRWVVSRRAPREAGFRMKRGSFFACLAGWMHCGSERTPWLVTGAELAHPDCGHHPCREPKPMHSDGAHLLPRLLALLAWRCVCESASRVVLSCSNVASS